jgi:tetratricopeptide (TPR) repeat protein
MNNDEAKALYQEALDLIKEKRFAGALESFDRLYEARPDSTHVLYYRTRCQIELARAEEAEQGLKALQGRLESDKLKALHDRLAEILPPPEPPSNPAPSAPEVDTASTSMPASTSENILIIESVIPVSTDETSVTGHVKRGVFHPGDTVTIVSPDGMPLLAPVMRIGTQDTPLKLVREGQKAVMLLQAEPNHVSPGSIATCDQSGDAYAQTMVVSTDTPSAPEEDHPSDLNQAEKLLRRGMHTEAEKYLQSWIAGHGGSAMAHRLLAQCYLEDDSAVRDTAKALEHARKAFESGGANGAAVINTLAHAMAENGEAGQGLRFLERLYSGDLPAEARMAVARRIVDYRNEYDLGHVWEFADSYGEVLFESGDPREIVKAITSKTVPLDARCRKDHVGEWRAIEPALGPDHPEIAALYQKGKKGFFSRLFGR